MKVVRNATGTGFIRVKGGNDKAKVGSADFVTKSGSLTVFIDFDTGTKSTTTADIHDAVKNAVARVTGASDVKVFNRGAALIGVAA